MALNDLIYVEEPLRNNSLTHPYNGHFLRQFGLAGTRECPILDFFLSRMTEVVTGDNWSYIRRAKLQSKCHHQQTQTSQTGCSSCRRTSSISTEGRWSPGVEQAVGQGRRMPLQISMQGGREMVLPSHFSMASLPVVRLNFGEN